MLEVDEAGDDGFGGEGVDDRWPETRRGMGRGPMELLACGDDGGGQGNVDLVVWRRVVAGTGLGCSQVES